MMLRTGVVLLCLLFAGTVTAQDGGAFAIVGGLVHTMTGPPIANGTVLVRGGKIEKVGAADKVDVPKGYEVIDAAGKWVVPGFIEMHNHTLASDLHDNVFQVNPELRVLDNVDMDGPAARIAVAGGITTALIIPGSGSNMGGFGVIVKTYGKTPKDVIMKFPGALKIAQAGNPEQRDGDLGATRMGMNWMIRNVLQEGKAYHQAWTRFEKGETKVKPEKSTRYEYLRGLFRGDYPVAVHTQMMQVVQSTMRILHDELGLKVVVDHGTFTGYLNSPEFAKRRIPAAIGPREFWYDQKVGRMQGCAAAWYWLGLGDDLIGINTDSPGVPEEELFYQGTWCIRMGLPERAALRGLTINAARMLMIQDRVGTLEPGKDADICVWTGDPFDPRHRTQVVLVNGKKAYDADRDGIRF